MALTPFAGGDPVRVEAAGDCTTGTAVALDSEEQAFLTQINNYRVANGRSPLKASYMLSRASWWKSNDMATNAYFGHDDTPIGRSWSTRVRDCGYTFNTYIGENIAAGYNTAASVFSGWQNSPGHNSNMLGSSYTVIGIGRVYVSGSPYGYYWTTVFGGYDDGWVNASEGVTPVAGGDGTSADGAAVASSSTTIAAGWGSPGALPRRRLDFSRTCAALIERRMALAWWFCR